MAQWLMKQTIAVCDGYFPGDLYALDNYPAACYDSNSESLVHGVVLKYPVESTLLEKLDEYEEVGNKFESPTEFQRMRVKVMGEDCIDRMCWVYLYNRPTEQLLIIKEGKYLNHDSNKL